MATSFRPNAADRSRAARRRRARRLSGRRLSGAARRRHRARLDHRHVDRRDQREPDRRQSGDGAARAAAGILEPHGASTAVRHCRRWTGIPDTIAYWQTLLRGIPAFFEPNPGAFLGTHVPLGVDARRLLLNAPLEKTLLRARGLRADQHWRAAADRRRRTCAHQHDAILRQPRHADRRQAHHGVRRAAAGVSGGADRRRAVLGRRHPLQHADRGDLRRQSAQELADLRRASVEPDGRGARARSGRC